MTTLHRPPSAWRAGLCLWMSALCLLHLPAAAADDWRRLTQAQQSALAPLRDHWAGLEPAQRQKWLELSARLPAMAPEERERVHSRMAQWAQMSPQQRSQARLQFQDTRQALGTQRGDELRSRWQAYQELPDDQRRALGAATPSAGAPQRQDTARRAGQAGAAAVQRAPQPGMAAPATQPAPAGTGPSAAAAARVPAAKHNRELRLSGPAPRPVGPALLQARPGATTTTLSTAPSPVPLHQSGLPRVNASPGFVDAATLLPQRGVQGAAATPQAAAASAPRRRP